MCCFFFVFFLGLNFTVDVQDLLSAWLHGHGCSGWASFSFWALIVACYWHLCCCAWLSGMELCWSYLMVCSFLDGSFRLAVTCGLRTVLSLSDRKEESLTSAWNKAGAFVRSVWCGARAQMQLLKCKYLLE